MRRLWLVDHLLENFRGHFFHQNLLLAEAARDLGWEVEVIGSRHCENGPMDALQVRRVFRRDLRNEPHPLLAGSPRSLTLLDRLAGRRYREDLFRAFACERLPLGDVIFSQARSPRHLVSWLKWMFAQDPAAKLILHLGYQAERFAGDPRVARLVEQAASPTWSKRLFFVSDSAPLAGKFEAIVRRTVSVVPIPISPKIAGLPPPGRSRPLTFASIGNARAEKGFADILEAIAILGKDCPNVEFLLQANYPDPASRAARERFTPRESVTFVDSPLDENEYLALLARAHAVMLPYHLKTYAERSSGIFCEALGAGRPVIVTEHSWMDAIVRSRGLGWLTPEKDPVSLARRIAAAALEYEDAATRAREEAAGFRRQFSSRALFEQFLHMIDGA